MKCPTVTNAASARSTRSTTPVLLVRSSIPALSPNRFPHARVMSRASTPRVQLYCITSASAEDNGLARHFRNVSSRCVSACARSACRRHSSDSSNTTFDCSCRFFRATHHRHTASGRVAPLPPRLPPPLPRPSRAAVVFVASRPANAREAAAPSRCHRRTAFHDKRDLTRPRAPGNARIQHR